MRLLITGVCGFVGSRLANWFRQNKPAIEIIGIDNFIRPGSETNRLTLKSLGVKVQHADIRSPSDFENLPTVEWVIDAAANPSVLAGSDGLTSSRQIVEHNLRGTLNLLEYCKRVRAGLILLSTSRVYSIPALCSLPLVNGPLAFEWKETSAPPIGVSSSGLDIEFSTARPLSLYGSTKLASEVMALEYGYDFSLPVWINRCGVLAGVGQFGTAEQGIFSFWVHAYSQKRPLKYIGFEGSGRQVRDALHPQDLAELVSLQMKHEGKVDNCIFNAGGGKSNAMSLGQLTNWCKERFGEHDIGVDPKPRSFDVPWVIMDNHRATEQFGWIPKRDLDSILKEIADHARADPHWLDLSSPQ